MLTGTGATRSGELSRRNVLSLLGAAAGLGLVPGWRGGAGASTGFQAPGSSAKRPTLPRGAIVRTVLKDLPPEAMGPGSTLFHEHIGSARIDPIVVEALNFAKGEGVSCLVNAKAGGGMNNVENLRILSTRTAVHIVACEGYYMQNAYPPELATWSEEQIAEDLVQKANHDGLGAFGEIGQSANSSVLTPGELKVFRAVGKAHLRTNLPIFTHNAYGTGPNVPRDAGLRQLDAFEAVGVRPERVAIGHVCCLDDPKADIIKQLAKRGAFVGFDRLADHHPVDPKAPAAPMGNVQDTSDELRVRMIREFIDAGHVEHLLLADDSTAQPNKLSGEISQLVQDQWLTEAEGKQIKATLYRAMGIGRTVGAFVPKLRAAGVSEATLRTILHDNPLRFLAFEPKTAG
jgi:phosphotriesterase-related protein